MHTFIRWIKVSTDHKRAFESSHLMQIGKRYLGGNWKIIRKIRFVRFVRKMIEEGIIVRGVKEIYEEGWRILSEMERREVKAEEEEYMFELYLMKVRGMEKKMKEDEVEVLRRKLEEANKRAEEEKKRADEAEEKITRMKIEMEEMRKKEGILHTPPPSNTPHITRTASNVITSLNRISVIFTPNNDYIKREGNTIIHYGPDSDRNCFIGGVMTSVCNLSLILFDCI